MERPRPVIDKYNEPYWDGLLAGELKMPRCRSCGHLLFPMGPCCSECLSEDLEWVRLSGRGVVWSYVIYHHAYHPAFADEIPYNVALIRLEEGPQIISNVVGIPNEAIRNGLPVEAVFERADDRVGLVRFRPSGAA